MQQVHRIDRQRDPRRPAIGCDGELLLRRQRMPRQRPLPAGKPRAGKVAVDPPHDRLAMGGHRGKDLVGQAGRDTFGIDQHGKAGAGQGRHGGIRL